MRKMNKKLVNLAAVLVVVSGSFAPVSFNIWSVNENKVHAAENEATPETKPEGEKPETKPEDVKLTYKGLDKIVGYTFTTIDLKKGVEITDEQGTKYDFEVKASGVDYEKANVYDLIYIVYDQNKKEIDRKNRVLELKDRFEVIGFDEANKFIYGGAGLKESVDWKKGIKAYDHAQGEGEAGLIKAEQLVTDFEDWDKEVTEAPFNIYFEEIIKEKEPEKGSKAEATTDKKVLHKLGTKYLTLTAHAPKLEVLKPEVYLAEGNSLDLTDILKASDPADKEINKNITISKNEDNFNEEKVQEGVYNVEHTVTNKYGKKATALVKYTVFAAPVCVIPDMKIEKDTKFDPKKDVKVTFKKEPKGKAEDVTEDLVLPKETEIDTSKKGTYNLTYKYTHKGITWNYVRRVVVADKEEPWITAKPVTITATSDKNMDLLKKIKFTAKDHDGTSLQSKVTIKESTNKVDLTKEGEYEVILQVKGEKASAETPVKVKVVADAPELEVKNLTYVVGTKKEDIDLKTAITSAQDKVDGDLTKKVEIEKVEIDTSKVGQQEVIYTVTNSNKKKTTKKIIVNIVEEKEAAKVSYSTHVQEIDWQDYVSDGKMAGTTGKGLRLEGVKIKLENVGGKIEYRTHIQDLGWEEKFVSDGAESGTVGRAKRLEAIQIKLSGEAAEKYDVYYRVHAQNFGWLGWAKNGASAGTEGFGYRLEGLEVKMVPKGNAAPGVTTNTFKKKEIIPEVNYRTHVQNEGWQGFVADGKMSGTEGKGLRLEGIKMVLTNLPVEGGIEYATHVQNIGWQKSVKDGKMSGTEGKSLRLEGIHVKLTGKLADSYDIYYRVHAQNFGWLGWAKNDEKAGTEGFGYRLEGIEVKLVKKGEKAPGNTEKPFVKKEVSKN